MGDPSGMVYPSLPPSADNDGSFACSLPLFTHPAFKGIDTHEVDGRSHWIFLKHPTKSAAFTDLSSFKLYILDLNDPDYKYEDHHNSDKVVQFKKILHLAHAHYKFCVAHHRHRTTAVQKWNSIQLVPEEVLHRLVFYDPSSRDERLKLPREHDRMGKLFPCDYYTEDNPAPAAKFRPMLTYKPPPPIDNARLPHADALFQSLITYKEALATSSSAPIATSSKASASCASTASSYSVPEASIYSAPTVSTSAVCAALSPPVDGPWFLLSDGQLELDPVEAERLARNGPDGTRLTLQLVDTLAQAQKLRQQVIKKTRKAKAHKPAGGGA